MDVVVIFNGLGNQMSQYAFYTQKKKLNDSTCFIPFCRDHNGLELSNVFGINIKLTLKQKFLYILFRLLLTEKFPILSYPIIKMFNFFNIKIQKENFDYSFKLSYLNHSKGIIFYYGGWHSEQYFVKSRKDILKKFVFNEINDNANLSHIKHIVSTNSVSLHIRRGDFLNAANINLFGDVCTLNYYTKAVELIESKVSNPHFFVFSNDLVWVKENLNINNVTYVDCNSGNNSWKDMCLMSLCKHNIIANSTFSWWGAWLNKNSDKIVVSPSRFLKYDSFTDVYPDSWIKISEY